jgi:hypothetical protein
MKNYLKNNQSHIYNALLKHGHSNFSRLPRWLRPRVEIIEYCEPSELLIREKYYIDLGSEYNIVKDPTLPPMSGRTHSDETKQKISDTQKGNTNKKGKPKTVGSGKPSQIIEVFDEKTNKTTTYNSMGEAARALNIPFQSISAYFIKNRKKPYKGQYIFKKLEF